MAGSRQALESSISEPPSSGGADLSVRHLAHELNSLLDGSRRFMNLARRGLASGEPGAEVLSFLASAGDGLEHMAGLLRRAMISCRPSVSTLNCGDPLGVVLTRVVDLSQPLADELAVAVEWRLDGDLASLPAGPLEPVVMNGLRNAIQAAAMVPAPERVVVLQVRAAGGVLEIAIDDPGPGPLSDEKPDPLPASAGPRHGLGLGLCRQIVAELGGTLELLREGTPRGGTLFRVRVPLSSSECVT